MLARALGRAGAASRRVGVAPVYGWRTMATATAGSEGGEAASPFSDPAGFGVDRSRPEYAPSPHQEWMHRGYDNVAPSSWSGWNDLPEKYRLAPIKLDPKDVEEPGPLWDMLTSYKTALPFGFAMAIPLFVNDVVVIDSHLELAAVFWTCMMILQRVGGGAIKDMFLSESRAVKSEMLEAESRYLDALGENVVAHERLHGLPRAVRELNAADRQLRVREAHAATLRVQQQERDRMVAMLDFLVAVQGSDGADEEAAWIQEATERASSTLLADEKAQQAMLDEAIKSLKSGTVALPTAGKAFDAALQAVISEPEQVDAAEEAKEQAKLRDMFAKRFGFTDQVVSEKMLERANASQEEMAVLTAKCGGKAPALGAKLVQKMPIDY